MASQPLDCSTPVVKKARAKYPKVVTSGGLAPSPSSYGGLTPSHSFSSSDASGPATPRRSYQNKAKINADGTRDFGPVKASRNYKIGESIEMHSGYVSGCLVLSISAHEESDKAI